MKLFCRPGQFGKTFTLSMLQYFHSVGFDEQYSTLFGDLHVNDAVQKNEIQPGRYIVLEFDFAYMLGLATDELAVSKLQRYINAQLGYFVKSQVI